MVCLSGHAGPKRQGFGRIPSRAVSDLSLEVNGGEIFGFLGLNGEGKSTTIKMMLSLLKPTSGSIYMLVNKVDSGTYKSWEQVGYLEEAAMASALLIMAVSTISALLANVSKGLSDLYFQGKFEELERFYQL